MTKQSDRDWREHVLNMAEGATSFTPAPTTTVTAPTPLPGAFPGPPSFDPIELLPPASAERLRLLRDRCSEKHAAMIPHSELQEAVAERTRAEQNLRRLQAHPADSGFGLPPTDARCIAAEQQVARTSDNARRLSERSEKLAAAWRAVSQPLAGCEDFLKNRPGNTTIEEAPIVTPKKNEPDLIDAVENRRRRCRELHAAAHRVRSSPYPSAHAKAKMREQIALLAQRGEPSVSRLVEVDGPVELPVMRVRSEVVGADQRALAFAELPDIALVAWLDPSALIRRLDELIDAESDDGAALSVEARETALSQAQADLLAVEREESFFVWSAIEQGLHCEHRPDCSACAILGIELRTTPRADALPETSPGFSWPWRR